MQRVALARSLVMRPSVLLFDEPLSNLDARLRDHLRVQLREIQTQLKISSVYVTHDQREALALADQIVMMQSGKIMQAGDPVSLYSQPQTAQIAEFLGYSNIYPAKIVNHEGGQARLALLDTVRSLQAKHVNIADAALAVCVRPDDISIAPAGEVHGSNVNRIDGEIILASFLGSQMQYRLRAAPGEIWEVLSSDVRRVLKIGQRAQIYIDPANIKVLPKQ